MTRQMHGTGCLSDREHGLWDHRPYHYGYYVLQVSYYLPSYLPEEHIFVPPHRVADKIIMEAYSEQELAFEGRLQQHIMHNMCTLLCSRLTQSSEHVIISCSSLTASASRFTPWCTLYMQTSHHTTPHHTQQDPLHQVLLVCLSSSLFHSVVSSFGQAALTSAMWCPGTIGDVDVSSLDEAAREAHIAGVKSNLHLAQAAAQALGDVPPILSAPGFLEHGPDEKAVIIFLAFLCARVLEVSKEDRAAQVIQHTFRHRKSQQPGQTKLVPDMWSWLLLLWKQSGCSAHMPNNCKL